MILKTAGIVLHNTKYRESSLVTKIYTRELGLVSYIINGVRSSRKKKNSAAILQPLNILELVVYNNNTKNIQRVKDFKLLHLYNSLQSNYYKSLIAIFILEILNKCIKEEESNEELFAFLYSNLVSFDTLPYNPNFHLYFALHLTRYLGFFPQNNFDEMECNFDMREGYFCAHATDDNLFIKMPYSQILDNMLNSPVEDLEKMKMNREERKKLLEYIVNYYRLHVENFSEMKSLKVMENMLTA